MTREELLRLAHESECLDDQHYGSLWVDRLVKFAGLVAAVERERAAKVCESLGWGNSRGVNPKAGTTCAAAIRSLD